MESNYLMKRNLCSSSFSQIRSFTLLIVVLFLTSCKIRNSNYCLAIPETPSEIVYDSIMSINSSDKIQLTTILVDFEDFPLSFSDIAILTLDSVVISRLITDSLGECNFELAPGFYLLYCSSVSFSSLKTKLYLREGEAREIKVKLGSGAGFVTYGRKQSLFKIRKFR